MAESKKRPEGSRGSDPGWLADLGEIGLQDRAMPVLWSTTARGGCVGAVARLRDGGGASLVRRCGPAGSVWARGRVRERSWLLSGPWRREGVSSVALDCVGLENEGTRPLGEARSWAISQRWG